MDYFLIWVLVTVTFTLLAFATPAVRVAVNLILFDPSKSNAPSNKSIDVTVLPYSIANISVALWTTLYSTICLSPVVILSADTIIFAEECNVGL